MNTNLARRSQRLVWLRLGMIVLVLSTVVTFLLMTNSEPAEAAPQVTLHRKDMLIAGGDGCSLKVLRAAQFRARLGCEAFTPTATATDTSTANRNTGLVESGDDQDGTFKLTSDVVTAPEAKVRRLLKPGKELVVVAAPDECKLVVVEATASLVRIKCKPLPPTVAPTRTLTPTPTRTMTPTRTRTMTPTRTRTMTPTRTNTPRPAVANLYIGNYTGGTLCYEVYNTGIGEKCFGGGDSFYGSFSPGTYTYHVAAICGSLTDSAYYPPGDWIHAWACGGGISSHMSEKRPGTGNSSSPATPSR